MIEWGCGLYSGACNLLTFVSFCGKNMGVRVICGAGYSPENMVMSTTWNCPFKIGNIIKRSGQGCSWEEALVH